MGIDKPMVITEPVYTVATTHLLGLGLKLYPSNMPLMLNKDLTRFMQSFSSTQKKESKRKARLCWQGSVTTVRWAKGRWSKIQ